MRLSVLAASAAAALTCSCLTSPLCQRDGCPPTDKNTTTATKAFIISFRTYQAYTIINSIQSKLHQVVEI